MYSLLDFIGVRAASQIENGREVEFTINGKQYKASNDLPADTSLNVFIREHANLKGTKFMCLEGGCGVCVVSVQYLHPTTKTLLTYSVNSCLVPIFACHGWSITTVEGLGNKNSGYHKIQKRLAAVNGTQCGYCTPGQIMNFYSLYESNPKLTMKEIENSLSGNLCRCTGYRPILDAFKSFASDAPDELVKKLTDIEGMACLTTEKSCTGKCNSKCCSTQREISLPKNSLRFQLKDGTSWYRPLSVKEVMEIFDMIGDQSYRFIAGNTGHGVYRIKEEPQVYIDINGIPELHNSEVRSDGITVGANIGLNELIKLLNKVAVEQTQNYAYCKTIADHIDLVANVPVRNTGTLAGNFTLKHQNKQFPSDLFLLFLMVDATVVLAEASGETKTIPLMEYLSIDMNKKIMVSVNLPVLDNSVFITRSYKIMPRAQNAHAYVNAGFKFKVDKSNGYTIMETPTVLFGGIEPNFFHATKMEEYLTGKKLLDNVTLQGALDALDSELNPDHVLPDVSPEYRKGLAKSLFYKFILSVNPIELSLRNISGGWMIQRPISTGRQDFDTDRNLWPLNKPVPKIEALIQCAGEAEYTNDIPNFKNELWAQLVLTDRAAAVVEKIDPSEALSIPGVVAFFSAKDIPGENNFLRIDYGGTFDVEPVFVDGRADYAGQAVGVVIAETNSIAIKAALKVKISYSDQKEVFRDLKKIIKDNIADRMKHLTNIHPTKEKADIKYKINGEIDMKAQYHFPMETQTCLAVPVEDHLEVFPTTQWPTGVQNTISQVLNIPVNKITLQVRRLGGAYGAKVTRNCHTSAVCSLAAYLLHRPVRMVLKLETNMEWSGSRNPIHMNYEVGVNENGEIQYLNANIYEDQGHAANDSTLRYYTLSQSVSAYDPSTWTMKGFAVLTDAPSNTWCRSPGTTEGVFFIETVMEHIANVTQKDPLSVRLANMNIEHNDLFGMIEDVKKMSDYEQRLKDIELFNQDNRWKKRGITLIPMVFNLEYWGIFHGTVSVFGKDGSVTVIHGAIEMGQGVNTKVAQVAAHILGVDLDQVTVQPTTNVLHPNNEITGGSSATESVCYAVKICCEVINERLKPIKEELGPNATWKQICNTAYQKNVNLNHTHHRSLQDLKAYKIYGVIVTEVEVDVLTGQYMTRRIDMIQDAGASLSPDVDVGQVEGAIIMGLGLYTYEETVYSNDTGATLTNRTWNYKVPGAKDIPADFRITLRKNAPNPIGVLRSKATGEPPFCLSCSVLFAIRNAMDSARKDVAQDDESWFEIDAPFTPEKIWLSGLTKHNMFSL